MSNMYSLLCFCLVICGAMSAPTTTASTGTKTTIIIDYKTGVLYQDLAAHYLVLSLHHECFFWHLVMPELQGGMTPQGYRHTEHTFLSALKQGVTMTQINRSNFNHMAGSIIYNCKDKTSYLIHRGHFSRSDMFSMNLQGIIDPTVKDVHGIAPH